MSSTNFEPFLKAIREAGGCLVQHWPGGEIKKEIKIEIKADGSKVTSADFASNDILVAAVQKFFPEDSILSEEGEPIEKEGEYRWIIDPLDGTSSFIDGKNDFSILAARVKDGEPHFGVMYFPAQDKLATAEYLKGARVKGQSLSVSKESTPRKHSIYFRHCFLPESNLGVPEYVDSGQALLNVCRGEYDGLIIRIVNHKSWDIAAPALVLQESGGVVTDEKGEDLKFVAAGPGCEYVVASNGSVHSELLRMIPLLSNV